MQYTIDFKMSPKLCGSSKGETISYCSSSLCLNPALTRTHYTYLHMYSLPFTCHYSISDAFSLHGKGKEYQYLNCYHFFFKNSLLFAVLAT